MFDHFDGSLGEESSKICAAQREALLKGAVHAHKMADQGRIDPTARLGN